MADEEQEIEIHIPHRLGFEKIAMESAATLAAMMGFTSDRIEDLKTAVGEACINAIEHGAKGPTQERILITLTPGDSELRVDVRNSGEAFPAEQAIPNIEDKMSGLSPTRGWGLFLIRSLVDKVEFHSHGGKNTTNMVICLDK
jgi:serine/threonine-protein kinase RsbW